MSNELNITLGQTGLTVLARLFSAGVQSGSDISLTEIAGQGGYYTGNMPAVSAAYYDVLFVVNGVIKGSGNINWNGTAEVVGSSLTAVQIRTEMDSNSTLLANLDATVSSRLATNSYVTSPTAIQIRQEIDANSVKLAGTATSAGITTVGNTILQAVGSPLQSNSYVIPPTSSSIAEATAAVLFVDGATNPLKVNPDHSIESSNTSVTNYITVPAAIAVASQDPSAITCIRGDTLRVVLPLMGDLTSRTKLVMTAKASINDTDSQAILQIVEGIGLTRLNCSGSVDPASAGNANITAALAVRDLVWDVQAILSTGIISPLRGSMTVVADVTQSVT
jgi:hypothetical protein